MTELKPCPFCGGNVGLAKMGDDIRIWWIITRDIGENKCTCRVFMESNPCYESSPKWLKQGIKQKLIDDWNRRADNDR